MKTSCLFLTALFMQVNSFAQPEAAKNADEFLLNRVGQIANTKENCDSITKAIVFMTARQYVRSDYPGTYATQPNDRALSDLMHNYSLLSCKSAGISPGSVVTVNYTGGNATFKSLKFPVEVLLLKMLDEDQLKKFFEMLTPEQRELYEQWYNKEYGDEDLNKYLKSLRPQQMTKAEFFNDLRNDPNYNSQKVDGLIKEYNDGLVDKSKAVKYNNPKVVKTQRQVQ